MDLNDSAPLIKFNVAEFSTSFKARILLNKSKKNQIKKQYFSHIFFRVIFLVIMLTRKIQIIKL